jgi:hypothetical protein
MAVELGWFDMKWYFEEYCLLGCDAVEFERSLPTFRRNVSIVFVSYWRRFQYRDNVASDGRMTYKWRIWKDFEGTDGGAAIKRSVYGLITPRYKQHHFQPVTKYFFILIFWVVATLFHVDDSPIWREFRTRNSRYVKLGVILFLRHSGSQDVIVHNQTRFFVEVRHRFPEELASQSWFPRRASVHETSECYVASPRCDNRDTFQRRRSHVSLPVAFHSGTDCHFSQNPLPPPPDPHPSNYETVLTEWRHKR